MNYEYEEVLIRKDLRLLRLILGVYSHDYIRFSQEVGNELLPEIVALTSCIKEGQGHKLYQEQL